MRCCGCVRVTDLEDFDIIMAAPVIIHPAVATSVSLGVTDADAGDFPHAIVHTDDHSAGHGQVDGCKHYG